MHAIEKPSLKEILRDSFMLIGKTIFPILAYLLVLSVMVGLLHYLVFDITHINLNLLNLGEEYEQLIEVVQTNPDYIYSEAEITLQKTYPVLFFISSVLKFSFQMVILIFILLVTACKIVDLDQKSNSASFSWQQSLKEPFKTKQRLLTSSFLLLCGSILVTAGAMLFIVPGVILMILFVFSIHSMLVDEKHGAEALKGGRFYARDNVAALIIILFLSFFLPMLIQLTYITPLMNIVGFSSDNYEIWIQDPTTYSGHLILHNICLQFFQNLVFFWFPIVVSVAFSKIQLSKMKNLQNSQNSQLVDVKQSFPHASQHSKLKKVAVKVGQNHYFCGNCGKKTPIASKKCAKCGQLHKLIYQNNK